MDCPITLLGSITPLLNFNSEEPNPVNDPSSYWSYRISEGFFHDSYHSHLERGSSLLEGLTKSNEPSQSDDYLSCLCSASWFFSSNDGNNSESCDVLKNAGMDHARDQLFSRQDGSDSAENESCYDNFSWLGNGWCGMAHIKEKDRRNVQEEVKPLFSADESEVCHWFLGHSTFLFEKSYPEDYGEVEPGDRNS